MKLNDFGAMEEEMLEEAFNSRQRTKSQSLQNKERSEEGRGDREYRSERSESINGEDKNDIMDHLNAP